MSWGNEDNPCHTFRPQDTVSTKTSLKKWPDFYENKVMCLWESYFYSILMSWLSQCVKFYCDHLQQRTFSLSLLLPHSLKTVVVVGNNFSLSLTLKILSPGPIKCLSIGVEDIKPRYCPENLCASTLKWWCETQKLLRNKLQLCVVQGGDNLHILFSKHSSAITVIG